MRLESARDLKKEFTHRVDNQFKLRPEVFNSVRLTSPAQRSFDDTPPVAVGIAHHKGEHKIAIRVQHAHPEVDKLIEHFKGAAKGEVDVKIVGQIRAQAEPVQRKRHRPLRIGDSVGLVGMDMGAGTIACFVSSADPKDEKTYILSNNHVLAKENDGRKGSPVIQPGPADGGKEPNDAVATLTRFVELAKDGNRVDAAIAAVKDGININRNSLAGLGKLAGARDARIEKAEKVFKIGRTTGLTEGRVSAFEIDGLQVMYPYPLLTLTFDDQMEIGARNASAPFSRGGDSGALVVDSRNRAIGLLFAGNDTSVTYINHIHSIVDSLKIRFPGNPSA